MLTDACLAANPNCPQSKPFCVKGICRGKKKLENQIANNVGISILKTTLNIASKYIFICQSEYELIAEGQECGDNRQVILDTTFSCPTRCSKLVLADKRCGEYFELRYDKKICRCLDKTQSCQRSGDKETFLYRVPKSKSQTRLLK